MAFVNYKQGVLDSTGFIVPQNTGTWGILEQNEATWATWTNYIINANPIIWTSNLVDFGSVDFFTLTVTTEYIGIINSYTVHVSETGEFTGEETETIIQEGDTDIPSFYGRYVYVTIDMEGSQVRDMEINISRETFDIKLKGIDTTTLPGTTASRTLSFQEIPSQIVSVEIIPYTDTAFNLDVYVTDYPSSKTLIPVILSKTKTGPEFQLVGLDNVPRDGMIDVIAQALPGQQMLNGQIIRVT
jgi:hypothetical protein